MSEDILSPAYWKRRLESAPADAPHHAVFKCPPDRWRAIEAKHREILARTVDPYANVLDAGCGWGRLLDLIPCWWRGWYVGVDLSPDFIARARQLHPERMFLVSDLRRMPINRPEFDFAILVSVRPMVRRNLGDDVWAQMEAELRRVAHYLLFLEYDPLDEGSIE